MPKRHEHAAGRSDATRHDDGPPSGCGSGDEGRGDIAGGERQSARTARNGEHAARQRRHRQRESDHDDGDRLIDRARHLLDRWRQRRSELRLPGTHGGSSDRRGSGGGGGENGTESEGTSLLALLRESLLTRPREELERLLAPYLSQQSFERTVLTRSGLARAARGVLADERVVMVHDKGDEEHRAEERGAEERPIDGARDAASRAFADAHRRRGGEHPLLAVALATRDRDRVRLPSFITALDDSISRQYIPALKTPPPPIPDSYVMRDPGSGNSAFNAFVIGAVGLAGKLVIGGMQHVHAYHLERLHAHVANRPPNTPLLTVSNHKSVMDDPFMLASVLPWRSLLYTPGDMRWGLCAVDICFRNSLLNRFFTLGKVMPIRRGGGLQQEELFSAARKLARGEWLHVYPEGKVSQRFIALMRHGVGKMVALASEWREGDADAPHPIVVPIYHEGMETVMPQDDETNELLSMVPRIRRDVYMMVGEPIMVADIIARYRSEPESAATTPDGVDTVERVMMFEEICDRIAEAIAELRDELRARVKRDTGVDLRERLGAYD